MPRVIHFKPYPLKVGDKICIDEGPRRGDWLVIGVEEGTVRLRCPVSGREVAWKEFCYEVKITEQEEWPVG
ncbi:MAG: hypothetical protein KJ950_12540 [Proteobacteria bacterium]|nr:hypothetical protein [Pseudomonadota bacterium]MBU1687567.1 hypothetical protein [Pseudomonadota bacterium]